MNTHLHLQEYAADRGATAPDYAAIAAVLEGRRSIRRYQAAAVPRHLIDTLLQVAVSAPSAHNRQPWRFRVIVDANEKVRLADAMGEQLRLDRLADGDALELVAADVARSRLRITSAPAVVVVCLSAEDMDRYPDPSRRQAEYLMAVQSVAMAGQNLLLAAHAAGLGACWVCAPLFCPNVVRDVLGLPPTWEPQGMVTLGYPAHAGKPPVRRPLDGLCLPLSSLPSGGI
ncbi:Nitroreductase [Georgfuchsia toluolica]|uniref:Nitroreductase n=1 Tax=Georgfuchsia toluolica TaxID=424218 RepID=A0A916J724_9PROT|nr:nitroreductase family protein [Georgfuchsia toluolica]CAG4883611.1 Nitroreductase [Georgfuchsia toluolica]